MSCWVYEFWSWKVSGAFRESLEIKNELKCVRSLIISIYTQPYDTCVSPILNCVAGVWGSKESKFYGINLHNLFLRSINWIWAGSCCLFKENAYDYGNKTTWFYLGKKKAVLNLLYIYRDNLWRNRLENVLVKPRLRSCIQIKENFTPEPYVVFPFIKRLKIFFFFLTAKA